MKYYNWHKWYIFLLAAGLLTGCSADEPETPVKDGSQKEIKFQVSSATTTNATRASIFDNDDNLQDQNIRIDAYFHGLTTTFFSEALLRYRGFTNHFEFNTGPLNNWIQYYWPIEGAVLTSPSIENTSLDFVGYVPYILQSSDENVGTYAIPDYITLNAYSASDGPSFSAALPYTEGVVEDDPATPYLDERMNRFNEEDQSTLQEFMYAYATNMRSSTNNGTVDLEFKHPFALVNIYLKSAKRGTVIDTVKISGISTSGTYTHSNNGWGSLGNPANLLKPVKKTVPSELNFNAPIGGPYLVIPQTLSGENNLTVNLTYNSSPEKKSATLSTTWEPGKIYSYYLDFGTDTDAILINVTIEEWVTHDYKTPIDVK